MEVKQIKKNNSKKARIDRTVFIISFIIIPIVMFCINYIYVNFSSFLMAFRFREGAEVRWTLDNFTRFFGEIARWDGELSEAFGNTFKTFAINLIMFPISFAVSYFLYKKIWGHSFFRIVFYIPGIISSVVVSNVYREIVSSEFVEGLLQKICGLDYLPEPLAQNEFANIFVWLHMIWLGFPGGMILYSGTLSRIPDSIIEYAKIDGVNWLQEIFIIIIPLIWPTFSLMLILQFVAIFNSGGAVFLLTGGGKYGTNTFSNWCFMQLYNTRSSLSNAYNYMSAVGMVVTVVACTISLTVRWIIGKFFKDVTY